MAKVTWVEPIFGVTKPLADCSLDPHNGTVMVNYDRWQCTDKYVISDFLCKQSSNAHQ